tara:strand:- start:724 stop:861 length:138 start_codon:yes stop_codon:yes gene_type:complete
MMHRAFAPRSEFLFFWYVYSVFNNRQQIGGNPTDGGGIRIYTLVK